MGSVTEIKIDWIGLDIILRTEADACTVPAT